MREYTVPQRQAGFQRLEQRRGGAHNGTRYLPRAYYDRRADVLSAAVREGEPKYVVVGRGTFVIFADEEGIWSIDLEAESWDSDADEVFPLMKIEIW